ncbi:MAG: ABC transporter permease [Bacteroides sp.]
MKKFNNWARIVRFAAAREGRAIRRSYPVLLVLAGGIFVYGVLYNVLYAPEVVTGAPVAVVDHSLSRLSRTYVRWLEATPQVKVNGQTGNFIEAQRWMKEGRVVGIIYLPADLEQRVGKGQEAIFSLYATTDAFLYFEALQTASMQVMLAVDERYRAEGAVFLPPQGVVAVSSTAPVSLSGNALYNVTEGYGSYLLPAVLMIILFQTLLMVVGMLAGEEAQTGGVRAFRRFGRGGTAAAGVVLGKTLVYTGLYAVFALFLLGLIPLLFGLPALGNGGVIALLLLPYLLATSFLGLAASRWFTDSEAPVLFIAFFSVGLVFVSGVSYPLELMPWYGRALHAVLPAAPATLAFVQVNSMGASLTDVGGAMVTLWVQTGVYFGLAVGVQAAKMRAF